MSSVDPIKEINIAPWKQQYAALIDNNKGIISVAHLTVFVAGVILLAKGQPAVSAGFLVAPFVTFIGGGAYWSHIKDQQKYNKVVAEFFRKSQN